MREILFRGKRSYNGKWVYGNQFVADDGKCDEILTGYNKYKEIWTVNPATVGQYTGLLDLNGVRIFEGDIVDFIGKKGKIVYDYGAFGIVFKDCIDWDSFREEKIIYASPDTNISVCRNDHFVSLWEIYWNFNEVSFMFSAVKVIGNVYDNPELMEEESIRKCDTCVHRKLCEANSDCNYEYDGDEGNCAGCRTITCSSHSGNCEYYLSRNAELLEGKDAK